MIAFGDARSFFERDEAVVVSSKNNLFDPSVPPRLFVDIEGAMVDKGLQETFGEGLLESIKFARYTNKTVRVVLYIRSFKDYRVFALYNPFRIVMDIYGDDVPIPNLPDTSVAGLGDLNKPALSPLTTPDTGKPNSLADGY